jgi:predicted porin
MTQNVSRRDLNNKATHYLIPKVLLSLLGLGVGAVLSAPVLALELSLYGVGHLSADSIDTDSDSSGYVHSNSSRLGLKGSHEVRGAKILFQYESGVDLTGNGTGDGNGGANSDGQIFTRARDSFVGVESGFGTVLFGRLGALNQWLYDYNLFGDQVGDLGNIWGGDGLPGRADHAAWYRTPSFGGATLALTYVPDQGVNDANAYIGKAEYVTGGIKLGGAYANFGNGTGSSDTKVAAITASYDAGAFSVGGGWQRETAIGGVSNADRDKYTLGAAVKLGGSGTVKAQYTNANDLDNASSTSADQWAVGYDYAWDKNTTLYVAYASTNNDAGASYTSYNYGHGDQGVPALVAGDSPSAISVGVVYKFDLGVLPR